jgi:hypothetical protein
MKLAFSKPSDFELETQAALKDGALDIRWNKTGPGPNVILTEDFVRGFIGSKELSDATNIYILTDKDGQFFSLKSKMAQTYLNKQSGFEYAKQNNLVIVGQIYVPFADSPFEEWVVRLNFKFDQVLPPEFDDAEEVASTLQAFHDFAYSNFPSLRILSQEAIANGAKITVQLTKEGADVNKAGVRIFAKTASGYLAKTEAYTDSSGRAVFTAIPFGLDSGEKMTPEFGFKWVTNLARVDVAA